MNKSILTAGAVLLMAAATAMPAAAQKRNNPYVGGPGIVMAGSQQPSALPKQAREFINRHFKDQKITKCEQYFAKNKYEVELANGVDMEFDNNGKLMEIDAPDNRCLTPEVVKNVIHGSAYKRLQRDGLVSNVKSVEYDKRGRTVEIDLAIPEPDTYVFDINGNFIAISD